VADIAFPTAKVVFRAAAIAQDSDDSGSIPQEILLGGIRVTLIPSLKYVEVAAPPGGVNPTTYSLRTWNLITTNDGNLINMDDPEEEVLIVASDAFPGYVVSWKSVIEDPSGTLPPIIKRWLAPAGSIVDLTTVISVLPNNPNPIADYLQAVYDAREARDNAITARIAAETARTGAETALAAVPGAVTEQVTSQVAPEVTAATNAKNEAITARIAAETARTGAETALNAVPGVITEQVTSQVAPEVAAATTAKNDAVAAKNDASDSASAAAESAGKAQQAQHKAEDASLQALANAVGAVPEWNATLGEYPADQLELWLKRIWDGKPYGIEIPKGLSTACTKLGANAGIAVPIPGTNTVPAVDPYTQRGPFTYFEVNGFVDPDGSPHVTAIMGDGRFARDGSNGDVWIMAPVLFWRWVNLADAVQLWVCDTELAGFTAQPKALLPSGTRRPFMLYAKYALSVVNGTARSISGQPPNNRTLSHNVLITLCKNATTGYSGKSLADDWYAKAMLLLKYATKNSQSIFAGCTSHSQQYAPAVAESNVTRVLVTTEQASQFPVGSAVMLGSNVPTSTDRQVAQLFDVIQTAKIVSKEVVGSNTALNLNLAAPITTATTQLLSTAPWWTGGCDAVVGDGSPASNTSGREPFVIQGIEIAIGLNEILGDAILVNDGITGWRPSVVQDSRNATTAAPDANYQTATGALPTDSTDSAKYPLYPTAGPSGILYAIGSGASQSTGMCDQMSLSAMSTVSARAWRSFGGLSNGGGAGVWCLDTSGLGNAWWLFGSRISANGRAS